MNRVDDTSSEQGIKRPTIVSITNHGLAGAIWFRGSGDLNEGWLAKNYMGPDNPFHRFAAIATRDFSSVSFIAFVGCYTANSHPNRGDLLVESVNRGSTTALGFREIIWMGTRSEDDPNTLENEKSDIVRTWTKAFWNAALNLPSEPGHQNKENKPLNVVEAANYAAEAVRAVFGDYHRYNSRDFAGDRNLVSLFITKFVGAIESSQ